MLAPQWRTCARRGQCEIWLQTFEVSPHLLNIPLKVVVVLVLYQMSECRQVSLVAGGQGRLQRRRTPARFKRLRMPPQEQ